MRLHYMTFQKIGEIFSVLWHSYGIAAPVIVFSRFSMYLWVLLFRSKKTFTLDGRVYRYAVHLANVTFRVERAVEIPIALEMFPWVGNVLEIGNVLSQYSPLQHDIVDKYEKGDGVQNIDVVDYNPTKRYDLIVSISTLEHVGWDEVPKEPEKLLIAIKTMKDLLTDKGKMLVTVPLGYNEFLDQCIYDGRLGFSRTLFMARTSHMNDWKQTGFEEASAHKYGEIYPCANGIAIGLFEK